jgi:hypothetical protein
MLSTFLGVGKLMGEGSFVCAQVWVVRRKRVKTVKNKFLVGVENVGGIKCIIMFLS